MDNLLVSKQERKVYIDYLKAIAILFVVLQHANAYVVENSTNHELFFQSFRQLCSNINIPLFIFCAGYLCHRKPILIFYKERFQRIMVPFYVFAGLKLIYSNLISNQYAHGTSISDQLFNSFVIGNVYWFCYAMMLIFLLAPLIWNKENTGKINKIGFILSIICLIVTIIFQSFKFNQHSYFQYEKAIYYFPFFAFGYAFRQLEGRFDSLIRKINRNKYIISLACIYLCFVFLFIVGVIEWSSIIFKFVSSMSLALFLIEILKNAPNMKVITFLSKYSLQIMFLDAFYKTLLFTFLNHIIPLSVVSVFIETVLDILLSVVTCLIIEKVPYVRKLIGL